MAAPSQVLLKPQPGTLLDSTARTLVAAELAQATKKGDAPLLLVGEAHLGGPSDKPAIFIQLQSERECGSAGCSTLVYLPRAGKWVLVLDSIGGSVGVDRTRHNGMRDLIVGHNGRWTWSGKTYVDTRSSPNVKIQSKAAMRPKPSATKVTSPPIPDGAKTEPGKPDAPAVGLKADAPQPE